MLSDRWAIAAFVALVACPLGCSRKSGPPAPSGSPPPLAKASEVVEAASRVDLLALAFPRDRIAAGTLGGGRDLQLGGPSLAGKVKLWQSGSFRCTDAEAVEFMRTLEAELRRFAAEYGANTESEAPQPAGSASQITMRYNTGRNSGVVTVNLSQTKDREGADPNRSDAVYSVRLDWEESLATP